ncbi:MAG TPA: transporter substrate-binding domain-containing protein [Victivallales bacterium]|nr:transporter substrate-binding domain-containing protein [Victivallales bacterium]
MKKLLALFFIFLFIVFNVFASDNSKKIQSTGTLRIGWYDQYPFTYKKNILGVSTLTGMDIELSKAITRKANFNFKFIEEPWDTQLKMLKEGKIDVMLSGLQSSERLKEFRISNPIRKECTVIYTRKGTAENSKFKTAESFLSWIKKNNLKIGITKGNIYTSEEINNFIANPNNSKYIKAARCDFINLRNLKNNRVTAVFVDRTASASIVGINNWLDELVCLYYPKFEAHNVCYMLSKKTSSIKDLEKINLAINSLKSDGKYENIVKTYLMPVILNLTVNTWWYFYIVLAGTVAYCICALRMVMQAKQSLIGTLIFVSIYTVGGGALRGILTGTYPLFFIHQPVYIYTILIITLIVFTVSNIYRYIFSIDRNHYMFQFFHSTCIGIQRLYLKYIYDIIDSIGLAAFVVFGVIAALEVNAYPLILWGPILAMVTTSGGGIICNILQTRKFDKTMKNMYTEISALWGCVLSVLLSQVARDAVTDIIIIAVPITVVGAFLTRWLVCYFKVPSIQFFIVKWVKSGIGKE